MRRWTVVQVTMRVLQVECGRAQPREATSAQDAHDDTSPSSRVLSCESAMSLPALIGRSSCWHAAAPAVLAAYKEQQRTKKWVRAHGAHASSSCSPPASLCSGKCQAACSARCCSSSSSSSLCRAASIAAASGADSLLRTDWSAVLTPDKTLVRS